MDISRDESGLIFSKAVPSKGSYENLWKNDGGSAKALFIKDE
jgi:hypothetical protein